MDVLSYLYGLKRFGMKLGLEVIYQMMERLDNPQHKFKSIHVAGTNGKGSTAAYLANILQEAGYKVGLYTSPHLINFNERFQINGEEISEENIVELTKKIKDKIDGIEPTFFEFTTAMAFEYFAQREVDFAVVEVGLGGRLDATNVINPEIAVITNIGNDHEQHLGYELVKIAKEKAGIVKKDSLVVTAEKNKRILDYFKRVCEERKGKLHVVQEQINSIITYSSLKGQGFDTKGMVEGHFDINLLGAHQVDNASTAILASKLIGIKDDAIRSGLKKTNWPGRLELIQEKPYLFLDGAHNAQGMHKIAEYAKTLSHRKVLVLGIAYDKDIKSMVESIVPLFDHVILTQGNYKPAETYILRREVEKHTKNVEEIPQVEEAMEKALSLVEGNDVALITGSFYMIGDARAVLKKKLVLSEPSRS